MPICAKNSAQNKISSGIWSIFLEPQKIVGYFFTIAVVIPLFKIPLESTLLIFGFSGLLAIANAGYVAFIEKDYRKKLGNFLWLYLLVVMTIATFIADFTGVYIHAMVGFHEENPNIDLTFWKVTAVVFSMVGGFTLSMVHNITIRINNSKVNPLQVMLLFILCVILLVFVMWTSYQNNPHDLLRSLVNLVTSTT